MFTGEAMALVKWRKKLLSLLKKMYVKCMIEWK